MSGHGRLGVPGRARMSPGRARMSPRNLNMNSKFSKKRSTAISSRMSWGWQRRWECQACSSPLQSTFSTSSTKKIRNQKARQRKNLEGLAQVVRAKVCARLGGIIPSSSNWESSLISLSRIRKALGVFSFGYRIPNWKSLSNQDLCKRIPGNVKDKTKSSPSSRWILLNSESID